MGTRLLEYAAKKAKQHASWSAFAQSRQTSLPLACLLSRPLLATRLLARISFAFWRRTSILETLRSHPSADTATLVSFLSVADDRRLPVECLALFQHRQQSHCDVIFRNVPSQSGPLHADAGKVYEISHIRRCCILARK